MMRKSEIKQRPKGGRIGFVIFPVIFSLLALSISTAILYPYVSEFAEMSKTYFTDSDSDISADCYNIFVPAEESSVVDDEPEDKNIPDVKPREQKSIPLSSVTYPYYGQRMGELIIDDCQIYTSLYFGDGNYQLNNGVGMYSGGYIPGYGRTVMIAGHNNTAFNSFKYAQKGQKVTIRTYYGTYTYKITDIQVKLSTDSSAYDFSLNYENLIMYTCYPFDELNLTPYRCFVYAKLISGPIIDKNN